MRGSCDSGSSSKEGEKKKVRRRRGKKGGEEKRREEGRKGKAMSRAKIRITMKGRRGID